MGRKGGNQEKEKRELTGISDGLTRRMSKRKALKMTEFVARMAGGVTLSDIKDGREGESGIKGEE